MCAVGGVSVLNVNRSKLNCRDIPLQGDISVPPTEKNVSPFFQKEEQTTTEGESAKVTMKLQEKTSAEGEQKKQRSWFERYIFVRIGASSGAQMLL